MRKKKDNTEAFGSWRLGGGGINTGPPYTDGKERPKEEAGVSRWVGGRGNNKGTYKACPGPCKTSDLCTCLPEPYTLILHRARNGGQLYIVQMVLLALCSLKAAYLKQTPSARTVGGMYIARTGEGRRVSDCPRLARRSAQGHVPLMAFSNRSQNVASTLPHSDLIHFILLF